METCYGIFVESGTKQKEKLQALKQLSQSLAQNGAKSHTIAEIIDADNITVLKERLKQADIAAEKLQQAMQQNEANSAKEGLEKQHEMQQELIASNERIAKENNDTKIYVAELNTYFGMPDLDANNNGQPDSMEIAKMALENKKVDLKQINDNKIHQLTERKLQLEARRIDKGK